jgi:hypothetical protein
MPTYAVKVNSVDLATKGVTVRRVDGPWSFPESSFEELVVPGRPGAIRSSSVATVGARDLTASGTVRASTPEALSNALDAIDALCTGDVVLVIGITTTRRYAGAANLVSVTGTPGDPQFVNGTAEIELKFRLLDPYSEAITATTVTALATVPVATPLGTRPSRPVITLTGATNPVVTVKGPLGDTRGTFTLVGSGTFVIDCDALDILLGGVRTDDAMTAGDFVELACRAGEYSTSSWPTIETSSGSLSVTYREHYR